jgi:hypothetical protein
MKKIFHFSFIILHLPLEEKESIEFSSITNVKLQMKNEKSFS